MSSRIPPRSDVAAHPQTEEGRNWYLSLNHHRQDATRSATSTTSGAVMAQARLFIFLPPGLFPAHRTTRTGVSLSVVLPSPSWPSPLDPQQ